jgi:hypothetical protein
MTVADDHLARIGSVADDWDREDASTSESDGRLPDCAREALALSEALQPVIVITPGLTTALPPTICGCSIGSTR